MLCEQKIPGTGIFSKKRPWAEGKKLSLRFESLCQTGVKLAEEM